MDANLGIDLDMDSGMDNGLGLWLGLELRLDLMFHHWGWFWSGSRSRCLIFGLRRGFWSGYLLFDH